MQQGITSKNTVSILFLRREILMQQDIPLAHFLCDRVQGVERFSTYPRHFSTQVPPPRGSFSGQSFAKSEEVIYFRQEMFPITIEHVDYSQCKTSLV